MKIIDFEKKGNLVRFYLGEDDCNNYWGDDWDDEPYDCNAGQVYEEYVKGIHDVVFPFNWLVLEPCDGNTDCYYSKKDMIEQKVPCIIVVPKEVQRWSERFVDYVASNRIFKFYFGDKMDYCKDIKIWDGETKE